MHASIRYSVSQPFGRKHFGKPAIQGKTISTRVTLVSCVESYTQLF